MEGRLSPLRNSFDSLRLEGGRETCGEGSYRAEQEIDPRKERGLCK